MDNKYIKVCGLCKEKLTAEEIINNPDIQIIGMLYGYNSANAFYCFQHNTPKCGTSFILEASLFDDYIEETLPSVDDYQEQGCGSRCVHVEQLTSCESECYHAPYRRFLVYMINIKKSNTALPNANTVG